MTSYLVLARKYRPADFSHLKGQEFLVNTITNAIKLNRVAHAFLLTGIRGGGKTTTARILAKTLNCSNLQITENSVIPCMECQNCIAANGDKHPDIIELDAASRTGVDDMRSIIDSTKYSPLMGKYKIYIIDEVHMLSNSAFNSLLKTLEEPPSHVKFIFATTELRKIPVTILSRCQKFELRRLNDQELLQHLQNILVQENISAEQTALQLIINHAEGSVRDSLSLLDLVISNSNAEHITQDKVRNLLGYSDNSQIIALFSAIIEGKTTEALSLIKNFFYAGKDLVYCLQQLMELIHDLSKIKLGINHNNINYSNEDSLFISTLSDKLPMNILTVFWQMMIKGLQELQTASNQLISAEMFIIRLCYLNNIPSISDLITSLEQNPAINSNKEATTHNAKKIDNFEELVQLFHQRREMLLYHYLVNDVHLVEFLPNKIKLRLNKSVPNNFIGKITQLLQEWTNEKWLIISASSEGGLPTLSSQAQMAKEQEIEEMSKNDIVKSILENFSGSKVTQVNKINQNDF
jgi:DNA polymerase III subunit gamma/tau